LDSDTNKRIIVTGASGVGKTTLVEMLAPLLSLSVIPELARQICGEMGYQRIGDIPDQEAFKWKVLQAQIEQENALDSFISDRSTLDSWVLWQRWNICQAMSYDTERYYEAAYNQAQKYTHIIYVPPMFEPVDDGFRWTDKDYQKQIDRLIRMTIFEWRLTPGSYVIQSADTESRLQETLWWLDHSNPMRNSPSL
jgi:energy-coupling factor transporter ATP-binding protein EcfA2